MGKNEEGENLRQEENCKTKMLFSL